MSNIPAGRELDANVAEVVMGWKPHFRNTAHYVDADKCGAVDYSCRALVNSWHPSTSWDQMAVVVNRMRKLGWRIDISINEKASCAMELEMFDGVCEFGDTAPHAVCLAALAAVEGAGK